MTSGKYVIGDWGLVDALAARLQIGGKDPFIIYNHQHISWCWARSFVDALGSKIDSLNLRDQDPIAIVPRNRPHFAAAILSCVARGRSLSMIYALQSSESIAGDIEALRPSCLLLDEQDWSDPVQKATVNANCTVILMRYEADAAEGISIPYRSERAGVEDHMPPFRESGIEMLTSGTTGPPKRHLLSYDTIGQSVMAAAEVCAEPGYVYAPFGNIGGLYQFLPVAIAGQSTYLVEKFSLADWLQMVRDVRPVHTSLPPGGPKMLLDANVPAEALAGVLSVRSGAASIEPSIQDAFEQRYGVIMVINFGATEFGGPVTQFSYEMRKKWPSKIGSVGLPYAGAELRIVDPETGQVLPPNTEGILEVKAPRVGDHWIRTSDVAVLDDDGFMFHRGRADGAISRGGFKIMPDVVAEVMMKHPSVASAAVVGLPDSRLGQVPACAVQIIDGAPVPTSDELMAFARQHLFVMQVPTRFAIVGEMPRTPSHKISLPAVLALFSDDETAG